MKIALINTLYPPSQVGGAEQSVRILAEGLAQQNHDVVVISLSDRNSKELLNKVKVYRCKIENIYWPYDKNSKKSFLKPLWHMLDAYNPWMQKVVYNILKSEKPDIIHTHNLQGFSTNVWKIGEELSIPVIHTLRDYWLRCPKTTMYKNKQNCETPCLDCKFLSIPKKKASQVVKGVIGISQFILNNHLQAGYFEFVKHSVVIHNMIDIEIESPKTQKNSGEFKIGFLGRIDENKGIKWLIDIFKDSSMKLLIGGKGDKDILKYLSSLNAPNIKYLGYVNPNEFFKEIDVLIVPSLWHEPFGRVVIEAYGHSVPVIVSNKGGLSELVIAGETGLIFDPNCESVIEKVNSLRNNAILLQKMRKKSFNKSKEFISSVSNFKKHIKIYREFL